MKTPKRDIMPLFQLEGGHRLYKDKEHEYFRLGFFPTTVSRWKRKNREAQYKRTIARLTEENNHLRTLLTPRICATCTYFYRDTADPIQPGCPACAMKEHTRGEYHRACTLYLPKQTD